jgi:NagD protein
MSKRGFLIDMDGVIYRSSQLIPGAVEFINFLVSHSVPFLFLTNNSSRTRKDIVRYLNDLGFRIDDTQVFTSAIATARYISRHKPRATAFVIGEGGLLNALHECDIAFSESNPDFVVVGEGRTLNFEQIEKATTFVAKGSRLIATNLDPSCPSANGGIRPGCGAIVKMIEEASGKKAFSTGKPSPVIFREARKAIQLRTDETIMIGDTMETDILGGVQMGYHTILVLSGGTRDFEVDNFAYQPDQVIGSVADLLQRKDWILGN